MGKTSSFISPDVLASIRSLPLRARTAVEGFLSGLHRSPFKGSSVEFAEYRPYMPGDDPGLIDWKLYAKTDRYYVKEFEEESNLNCTILLDVSASMGYGSIGYNKLFYACTLAASLGYLAVRQRDALAFAAFDTTLREYFPARSSRGHLNSILLAMERLTAGGTTDLQAPLDRVAETIRRRGMVIVISDFLEEIEPTLQALRHFLFRGHNVLIFQVLDPAEIEFQFDYVTTFEDSETHERIVLSPSDFRKHYQQRLLEFTTRLREQVEGEAIEYALMNTAEPLDRALSTFLAERRIKA